MKVYLVLHGHFPSECDHERIYRTLDEARAYIAAKANDPCWERVACRDIQEWDVDTGEGTHLHADGTPYG